MSTLYLEIVLDKSNVRFAGQAFNHWCCICEEKETGKKERKEIEREENSHHFSCSEGCYY